MHRIFELDIALGTGMRKGEQYGLRWSDVDLVRQVITFQDTKNGTSRTVPMIDDVWEAFLELSKGVAVHAHLGAVRSCNSLASAHQLRVQSTRTGCEALNQFR